MLHWFYYILKTVWCMSILIWDYESVIPDVWPQNKCRLLWPIFHGPLILPYISKTIWWMCVIFSDNETVWLKRWPQKRQNKMTFISWSSRPGAAARLEVSLLGMQAAPSSIPTSGTFFRGDLVMKTFLRPFSLFLWFKKSSCQLLAKECALSTGKLSRRLAQEQCG